MVFMQFGLDLARAECAPDAPVSAALVPEERTRARLHRAAAPWADDPQRQHVTHRQVLWPCHHIGTVKGHFLGLASLLREIA